MELRYDRILPAVAEPAEVDAGLIIHESRFTYAESRVWSSVMDLGAWWER